MLKLVSIPKGFALAFGLAMAAAQVAWAGAPGYYVTDLVGLSAYGPPTPTNAYGETLLSNGTVIGETIYQIVPDSLVSWANSGAMSTWGTMTQIYTGSGGTDLTGVTNVFGDANGQLGVAKASGISLYSGGTLAPIAPLQGSAVPTGMSQNGLLAGYWQSGAGTAFAYDVATSKYYTFGSAGSWAQGVDGTYVVGSDGANSDGFVWNETNQLYTQIPGLAAAQGISDNGQLVAGLTQGSTPNAAVYSLSQGTYGLQATYWKGEATGVNNSGLVIGDNSNDFYNAGSGPWTSHAMAYFPGWNDPQGVDLNAYAPAGVTFDAAQAVNDAGQILVWSNGSSENPTEGNCTSYLLTPALPGDANLDGKVDINDLTIVLSHFGQSGATWSTGDFVGDGAVDINDLSIVLSHFGQSAAASAAGMAAVPEPAGAALLAGCGLWLLLCLARRLPARGLTAPACGR